MALVEVSKGSNFVRKTMSNVYKVTEIEGKGLGCVATTDIEKGSLTLTENPQICGNTEEKVGSSKWIKPMSQFQGCIKCCWDRNQPEVDPNWPEPVISNFMYEKVVFFLLWL